MNRTGPPDPLPVHQLLLSLLEPQAPLASWYERLLPCSGTLPQLTLRWSDRRAVAAAVGALRSLGQVIFINNPFSALLLLALLLQSPPMALDSSWEVRHNGSYGFNGALVGSAIATFADLGPPGAALLWALGALGGGATSSVLVQARAVVCMPPPACRR
jgi:urea transporter